MKKTLGVLIKQKEMKMNGIKSKEEVVALVAMEDRGSFRLQRVAIMLRRHTEVTKDVEVMMKANLAWWAKDASLDCLYGYVAGKVDEAFYMEEDKFDVVYEISYPIAEVIGGWIDDGMMSENYDEDLVDFSTDIETDNFTINVWYSQGLNDFSANVTRKKENAINRR